MANTLYDKALQKFLEGGIAWGTADIKAVLVDLNDYALLISAATNAAPIVITTSAAHGLSTGDRVAISNVAGNTAANGNWTVSVVNSTQFSLDGSTGNGSYTSGGYVVKVSRDEFLSDVPSGARVATSGNLSGKTTTLGVADADDVTFSSVSGDVSEAVILYKDTGAEGTSALIALLDGLQGLPVTPNGSNIIVQWNNSANKIFKL